MNVQVSIICCFILLTVFVGNSEESDCLFPSHVSETSKRGESLIEILKGHRFEANDKDYTYYIGICVTALDPLPEGKEKWADVAVIQKAKHNPSQMKVIGRLSSSDIMAGPNWVLLEYNKGDRYGSHCKEEERRARIMFICGETASDENAAVIEKQNNKTDACYYLFEIKTAAVCKNQTWLDGRMTYRRNLFVKN